MSLYHNPFPAHDDRHAIWKMLVYRDIEAFVAMDWETIKDDFAADVFVGLDGRGRDNPSSWRVTFPSLTHYQKAWLEQAKRYAAVTEPEKLREALINATILRDIEVHDSVALAHKLFDGHIQSRTGEREILRWQSLYQLRNTGGSWKITGFIGYLPNPMGTAGEAQQVAKKLPPKASQHKTAGPYSPVLRITPRELVVISGQAAIDVDGKIKGDNVLEQAELTLQNCQKQLESAGCSFQDVFKVNVYMTNLTYWQDFNLIYEQYLPDPKPVRTAVQTALLEGLLIEVEMWAAKA